MRVLLIGTGKFKSTTAVFDIWRRCILRPFFSDGVEAVTDTFQSNFSLSILAEIVTLFVASSTSAVRVLRPRNVTKLDFLSNIWINEKGRERESFVRRYLNWWLDGWMDVWEIYHSQNNRLLLISLDLVNSDCWLAFTTSINMSFFFVVVSSRHRNTCVPSRLVCAHPRRRSK